MDAKNKPVLTARHKDLVDLVLHKGSIAYLMLEKRALTIKPKLHDRGLELVSPPLEALPHSELLSEADEVVREYCKLQKDPTVFLAQLYKDLRTHLTELSEMPDRAYYDLLAVWTLLTYIHERFAYSPIIVLFAVVERGKSRTGKGLTFVAYRGLTINSLRESFIFRTAQNLGSTMFFDISQFKKVMDRCGSEDMMLARFEKNATVPRVDHPEWGAFKDTTYYRVYGPTIIGTNQALSHALSSRSITIIMPQSERMFTNDVVPANARDLRVRLTAFRAYAMHLPIPSIDKPARGRLGDITRPLIQVAQIIGQAQVDTLLSAIKKIEAERMDDKSQTVEAEALAALLKCRNEATNGKVPLERVRDKFNFDRSAEGQYSAPSFGRLLKSLGLNAGGRQCRTSDGRSAVQWDEESIGRVCRAYGIEPYPEKGPEMPEQPGSRSETAGKQGLPGLGDPEDLDDKRGTIEPNYGE